MGSIEQTDSCVSQALERVNKAAQADMTGTGQAHTAFLQSIRKLTLAVEKPAETLMRTRFEVRVSKTTPSSPEYSVNSWLTCFYLAIAKWSRKNGHRGWCLTSHRC